MVEPQTFRYQSGQSVLELRMKDRGAVHYYFNGQFLKRFESLEQAFAAVHSQVSWPERLSFPPRSQKDWLTDGSVVVVVPS
jgi:hypothetical protein